MLKQVVNIFVIFLSLVQDAYGQQIYLFPYNETKNCNISLVEEMDTIVMYGKVDLNGNITASSVVNFDIKRETNSNFQSFCFVKVPEDCAKHFDKCNCYKTDEPKVFKLSISITALKTNDEAEIRAELVYREKSFYSEIRKLPIVYGFQTDAVLVYANDQCINFKQTDVAVNDKNVIILSVCREKFASHCELQLTNLETGTLVQSGKDIVVYITNFEGRANFKLTYSVCTIERNISFSITTSTTELILEWLKFLAIFVLPLTLILLLKACVKKYGNRVWSSISCNKNSHDENNEMELRPLIKETTRD